MPTAKKSSPNACIQGTKSWDISWSELQTHRGLCTLDDAFIDWLTLTASSVADELMDYRSREYSRAEQSKFILKMAPLLESFWLQAFQMSESYGHLQTAIEREEPVLAFRVDLVRRMKKTELMDEDHWQVMQSFMQSAMQDEADQEAYVANIWLNADEQKRLDISRWIVTSLHKGDQELASWLSLQGPKRIDWDELFPSEVNEDGIRVHMHVKDRSSLFDLSDPGYSLRQTQMDADYCIYCHKNQGDYCSIGFMNKKGQPNLGVRKSPLGETQSGCPLDQHISEMNLLRRRGQIFASLATVMVENPLCCLTGHRICSDCSLACIYQKQTPVDIPHIETRTLNDVLALDWGLEWYLLLMKWNPLKSVQYLPKIATGKRTAVVGLGPSGIASLHHLWMEGVEVVGFDGLTIMQSPKEWIHQPLKSISDWWEPLSTRSQKGFGGVAEYGITVRWDKNFLKLPQLAFARRQILLMGGVRLGGTLKVEDIWQMGFHHLVLALGAGLPHALNIPNSLAKGMRAANDFLMNLHLQGANQSKPLTLMDIRMPAVVIGGGLTSVDAATELQAYYIHLIKHVKIMVDSLESDNESFWQSWSADDQSTLKQWCLHASWLESGMSKEEVIARSGGVLMVYRRMLIEAPSYRSNAHELSMAMREGVRVLETYVPEAIDVDSSGRVAALNVMHVESRDMRKVAARTILLAIGSQPNVAYEYEHSGTFLKSHGYYTPHSGADVLQAEHDKELQKRTDARMMTSYHEGVHRVSYVGDLHPQFHGSVVKALASAKKAYPQIMKALDLVPLGACLVDMVQPYVQAVEVITERLFKMTIYSPMHARNALVGQFFRVHPFSTPPVEAIPLTLFEIQDHCLVFIIKAVGVSTKSLVTLNVRDPVAIMGPTGVRMRMNDPDEVTCIMSDEAGMPSACALAKQLSAQGIGVYLAYMASARAEDEWIETFAHEFLGVCKLPNTKDWTHSLLQSSFEWGSIKRVILQGKASFLKQASKLRSSGIQPDFKPDRWVGSVFGPMQCMLKGVCAECWQWQIDPLTKERTKVVFACSWQDQPLEMIDLEHLESRQSANSLLDRLSDMYKNT